VSIKERAYKGDTYRPQPEVFYEGEGNLCVIATPWGPRSTAEKAIQVIADFFMSSLGDQELTSPFAKMSCLSVSANHLRTAVMMANDMIYQEENKDEYVTGLEICVLAISGSELTYLQVGHPTLLFARSGQPLQILGPSTDLSFDHMSKSESGELYCPPPLPSELLGLHTTSNPHIRSIRLQPKDQIFMLSRSYIPRELFLMKENELHIEGISHTLVKENSTVPFWVGEMKAPHLIKEAV
jgi:hypothetical protein